MDLIDIDKFSVHEVDLRLDQLGYNSTNPMYYQFLNPEKNLDDGLEHLSSDQDCLNLAKYVEQHKVINVYTTHGLKNMKELFSSPIKPTKPAITIEEIDEPGPHVVVPFNLNANARQYSGFVQSSGAVQGNNLATNQAWVETGVTICDDIEGVDDYSEDRIDNDSECEDTSDSDYIFDAENKPS